MSSRIRIAGVTTIALAVAFALTPGAEAAGHHGTSSGGSRGGGSSTSSGHSSHSSSGAHISSGHSSGHTTSSAPPRTGSGHEPRGTTRSYRGYGGGGHGSGGSWGGHGHGGGGGHWYPNWYPSWYWGFTPYWASYGWLWGWPGYYDPFWSDSRYVEMYGDGGYYGGSGWRSSAWASRFGRVKTDVGPDEAEVWLNGKYVGTADDFDGYPDYLYLEPGSYKLEFRLGGYQTWTNDVNVQRGEAVHLKQELEREKGHGRLDSFLPQSKGVPDGRYFDKSGKPVGPAERRVRAKVRSSEDEDGPVGADDRKPRADVEAEPGNEDDDDSADVDVEIDKSPAREREVVRETPREVPALRARLRWKVTPEDAAIWVDDKYLGTADELSARPRGTTMAPGKHRVTVVRPGYESRTVTVEARAGEAVDVVVELED